MAAHNKLEVKPLMAPVISNVSADIAMSIPSLETDHTCQASVQTTLKETSAFIAEQTTRDTSGEAVSVSLSQVECRAYLEQRKARRLIEAHPRFDDAFLMWQTQQWHEDGYALMATLPGA